MAKQKQNEQHELTPVEVAPVARAVLPLWSIRRKSDGGEPQLIEAESFEDAIRAFNGASGMCGPNDLTVEKV